jgi:hypothetical protein
VKGRRGEREKGRKGEGEICLKETVDIFLIM